MTKEEILQKFDQEISRYEALSVKFDKGAGRLLIQRSLTTLRLFRTQFAELEENLVVPMAVGGVGDSQRG